MKKCSQHHSGVFKRTLVISRVEKVKLNPKYSQAVKLKQIELSWYQVTILIPS